MSAIITLTKSEQSVIYGGGICYCRTAKNSKTVFDYGQTNDRNVCSHTCFSKGYAFFHLDPCEKSKYGLCMAGCHLHPAGIGDAMGADSGWTKMCLDDCRTKHHC